MPSVRSEDVAKRLGERMKTWRDAQGLTLEDAGKLIGKDLQQWQRWESTTSGGANPTLKNLILIAEAMETDLPTLLADVYWPSNDHVFTEIAGEKFLSEGSPRLES